MADINVEETLANLTLEEKIELTSGRDFWHTVSVPRLGVPSLRFSDGPNGLRGIRFFNSTPAACLPCGTALGATWNPALVEELGQLLGLEAKTRGIHVVLGPTVNIQRSPLGGRGFESFAEDPVLSGLLAAAYVNGIQKQDILATIKHFVCNDMEDQRRAVDVRVSDRALREIYLLPFMLAVRDSSPAAFMTAYNKVNGLHVNNRGDLIDGVLRKEWGWDGLVMSDWFGTYTTAASIIAGADLEMPGPPTWRGTSLYHAINSGKVSEDTLDDRVRNILQAVKRAARCGVTEGQEPQPRDVPETAALLRKAAAESIVLMKNDDSLLPLDRKKTVAVIGPNSKIAAYCGGGSAALTPYRVVTPFAGIQGFCEDVKFAQGCYGHKDLPLLNDKLMTSDGKPGLIFRFYNDPPETSDRDCVDEVHVRSSLIHLTDYYNNSLNHPLFYGEAEGYLTPAEDSLWDFGLSVQGTARLFINGEEIIDNETKQILGHSFFGSGTREECGSIHLSANTTYKIVIKFASAITSKLAKKGIVPQRKGGVRLGGCPRIDPETAIQEAVALAKCTDQVVLFGGLNSDWEFETYDRPHMDLPPWSDVLISKVLEANPNTIIVMQSGTPIWMPWISQCKALVHAWYGGNETGNAIADVLFGDVNPSGKLPMSFPVRLQDNPAFLNSRCEGGRMIYGEDIFVGYRYYEKVALPALFPFGHGLSYTSFALTTMVVQVTEEDMHVSLTISNTGSVNGAEVIQVYISGASTSVSRPVKELKGWTKIYLRAGETQQASVKIPLKYGVSFWDENKSSWCAEQGNYEIMAGTSSQGEFLSGSFALQKTTWWKGI
ncbi:putative beta-glucosidase I [Xylariales sp. PMI_506]|nr:putative beta-glucosidase I [Xylariales sp. PMI_506]